MTLPQARAHLTHKVVAPRAEQLSRQPAAGHTDDQAGDERQQQDRDQRVHFSTTLRAGRKVARRLTDAPGSPSA